MLALWNNFAWKGSDCAPCTSTYHFPTFYHLLSCTCPSCLTPWAFSPTTRPHPASCPSCRGSSHASLKGTEPPEAPQRFLVSHGSTSEMIHLRCQHIVILCMVVCSCVAFKSNNVHGPPVLKLWPLLIGNPSNRLLLWASPRHKNLSRPSFAFTWVTLLGFKLGAPA